MLRRVFLLAAAMAVATPAFAQSNTVQEVVVTGSRIRREPTEIQTPPPEVGLKRVADFAVQQITVGSDTRDDAKRRDEIFAMVKGAIDLAQRSGVELATGTYVVEPLTEANYRNLPLSEDDRPDTSKTTFLVKTRLGSGIDGKAALDKITRFVHQVPPVGRAQMEPAGDLELSVVGPDQYRAQIVDLVAADARKTAAQIGADYAVEVHGVDHPVQWTRASLTEVFLYLPYSYTVVPKH